MRELRPDDIKEASEWYLGVSVRHQPGGKASRRAYRAKRIYWASLRRIGLSYEDIADVTGAERSSISRALATHPVPDLFVDAVLERATEQLSLEV